MFVPIRIPPRLDSLIGAAYALAIILLFAYATFKFLRAGAWGLALVTSVMTMLGAWMLARALSARKRPVKRRTTREDLSIPPPIE